MSYFQAITCHASSCCSEGSSSPCGWWGVGENKAAACTLCLKKAQTL